MMLRVSSQTTNREFSYQAIVDGNDADPSGVPNGELLLDFTDAVVARDEDRMEPLRLRIRTEMGDRAFVDVCGVVANFHRMTRIADGTGIPLDRYAMDGSDDLRSELGLNQYASAQSSLVDP